MCLSVTQISLLFLLSIYLPLSLFIALYLCPAGLLLEGSKLPQNSQDSRKKEREVDNKKRKVMSKRKEMKSSKQKIRNSSRTVVKVNSEQKMMNNRYKRKSSSLILKDRNNNLGRKLGSILSHKMSRKSKHSSSLILVKKGSRLKHKLNKASK